MTCLIIAARELRSLFLSPLAWVVLGVTQFLLAYTFLSRIEYFIQVQPRLAAIDGAPGVTDLVAAPLLGSAAFVLLMIVPLLSMRLLAEERRNGSLTLLLSAPLRLSDIVLGKYLGLLAFMWLMVLMIALMPLSLLLGTHIDLGQLAAGVLGLGLLLAAFSAIGLFVSSLSAQPSVAAIGCFGVLMFLWIIDWAGASMGQTQSGVLNALSLMSHYQHLLQGVFSSADVAYYLIVTTTFLALTLWRLDLERQPG